MRRKGVKIIGGDVGDVECQRGRLGLRAVPAWKVTKSGVHIPHSTFHSGHEVCGRVVALGDGGDLCGLEIGDLVSAESHVPCWECAVCKVNVACSPLGAVVRSSGVEQAGQASSCKLISFPLPF